MLCGVILLRVFLGCGISSINSCQGSAPPVNGWEATFGRRLSLSRTWAETEVEGGSKTREVVGWVMVSWYGAITLSLWPKPRERDSSGVAGFAPNWDKDHHDDRSTEQHLKNPDSPLKLFSLLVWSF